MMGFTAALALFCVQGETVADWGAKEVLELAYVHDLPPAEHFATVLELLKRDPGHALALDLIETVNTPPPGLAVEGVVQDLFGLRQAVQDPRAKTAIGQWLASIEIQSLAGQSPLDLGEDLFPDWFGQFWYLGPLGPLDHPEPLWSRRAPDNDPTVQVKDSYTTDWGETVTWQPHTRSGRKFTIPGDAQPYHSGGCVFFMGGTQLAGGSGYLDIYTEQSARILWNGQEVFFRQVGGLSQSGRWFRIPVAFRDGVNRLLMVTDGSNYFEVGARILDGDLQPVMPVAVSLDELMAVPASDAFVDMNAVRNDPREISTDGSFGPVLEARRHLFRGRPDLALDVPLAEGSDVRAVGLRLRHSALGSASYLPDEVLRQRQIAIEEALIDGGGLGRRVALARIERLVADDKPADAMQALEALRASGVRHPSLESMEIHVAQALDEEGTLSRLAIERAVSEWPADPFFLSLLARDLARGSQSLMAAECAMRALRLGSENAFDQYLLTRRLALAPDAELRTWFLGCLERRVALDPSDWGWEHQLQDMLIELGEPELALQRARRHAEMHPQNFPEWSRLWELAQEQGLAYGDEVFDLALSQVERLEPANEMVREYHRAEGRAVTADSFFKAFAPDLQYAEQVSADLEKASTSEWLDSGLIFLYPDGSRVGRMRSLIKAEDRSGTETLHEIPERGTTLTAMVRKADGTTREPVLVQGKWVMPSLDPGDLVEIHSEVQVAESWGAPVNLDYWMFASTDSPYGLSRYVVYIPDGLELELRMRKFEGNHSTQQWGRGTVHILTVERSPRIEAEPLMPSFPEIVPLVQFASDQTVEPLEQRWRQIVEVAQDLPTELGRALDGLVAELPEGSSVDERAEALYNRLTDYLVDFEGSANPASVWFSRRGQPILLFGALLARAEIPFEWAVFETGVAPELDPSPVHLFENLRGYEQLALRIQGAETVYWQVPPNSKGLGFGQIPDRLFGAKAMVLEPKGTRMESVPKEGLANAWDNLIQLDWEVAVDGSAKLKGEWGITTVQGSNLRMQLAQAPKNQRDGFVRQTLPNIVPGIDLGDYEIVDLDTPGAPLLVRFEASRPDFLEEQGDSLRAELRLPPTGVSKGLGPSERQWPLAARISRRDHMEVSVTLPEGWQVKGGVHPFTEVRDGYEHTVSVDTTGGVWRLERTFVLRGLMLPAEEMGGLLERAAELEREESRPLLIARPGTDGPNGQPKSPTEPDKPEKEGGETGESSGDSD